MKHYPYRKHFVPVVIADQAKCDERENQPAGPDPKAQVFSRVERKAVTPIKNQGQCGSCWAFSAAAVLESSIKMNYNEDVDLSEQNIISCSGDGSCNGGYWGDVLAFLQKTGPAAEKTFPHMARNANCRQYKTEKHRVAVLGSVPYVEPGFTPSLENSKELCVNMVRLSAESQSPIILCIIPAELMMNS